MHNMQSSKTQKHTILLAIFQVNLGKVAAPSVALIGRWGCHKVLQPVPHSSISTITDMAKEFRCKVFTGRMPYLLPNININTLKG